MSGPSAEPARVLVVVGDPGLQATFKVLLGEDGYEPHVVATLQEALVRVEKVTFALILADLFDDTSPLTLTPVHVLRCQGAAIAIGLLTTQLHCQDEAHAAGYDFIVPMPFEMATFRTQIATALDGPRAGEQRRAHRMERYIVVANNPPTLIATEAALAIRAGAAELRSRARGYLEWARDVQAEFWNVRDRAAAARRDAQLARARAEAMWAAAQEAWIRAEEVRALAEMAGEHAHALQTGSQLAAAGR